MSMTGKAAQEQGRTAFLVVHGVGQHEKYETLSYFAAGLMQSMQQEGPPERILVPFSDGVESALSLKSNGQHIDIIEYYYQPSLQGVVKMSDVTGFLFASMERIGQLSQQFRFDNNKQAATGQGRKKRADNDLLAWHALITHPKSIPSYLLLAAANGLYRLWRWMPNLLKRPLEWLGAVVIQNFVLEVVGDLVAYLAIDPKARLNGKRHEILAGCEQRIRELLSKSGAEGYERIVVAGHSLGSVVAYDALSRLSRDVACGRFAAHLCDRLAGFISFGSPLDKVAFVFWPTSQESGRGSANAWESLRRNLYAGMLPHFYGIRSSRALELQTEVSQPQGSVLDDLPWVNYYCDRDLISGRLDAYEGVENIKIGVHDKDIDIWKAFTDHSIYWESKEMFDNVVSRFFGGNKDSAQTERAGADAQGQAASSPGNGFFADKQRPLVLGHRGVPSLHQENTLAGFRRALEMGIDGVEFDVFKTRDDKIVVFHDEETERLTGVKGNITEMTWDEVSRLRIRKRVDMGDGNVVSFPSEERIPLLEEVLDEFKGKLLMNVEMKAYAPNWSRRHTGTEVARIIRRCGAENSLIITSFDFFMLYYLEKEYPGLHSGFAYDDSMVDNTVGEWFRKVPEIGTDLAKAPGNQNDISFLNFLLEANAVGAAIGSTLVDVEHTLIDSDTVDKFRAKGMLTGAYTVFPLDTRYVRFPDEDQGDVVRRLVEHRVDWMETDDPERVLAVYAGSEG
jgi:glycerophosphoryl diester phosphodiesterase